MPIQSHITHQNPIAHDSLINDNRKPDVEALYMAADLYSIKQRLLSLGLKLPAMEIEGVIKKLDKVWLAGDTAQ